MSNLILCGALLLSLNETCNPEVSNVKKIKIYELSEHGYNANQIIKTYEEYYDVEIGWWEDISISPTKEGDSIDFKIFDDLIINIDINSAAGPWNKDKA